MLEVCWRQGARCALAPELSPEPGMESLLGLQTFPQSVLLGHCWILPYTRLVLALVMLLSPRCFLSPSSLCACLPGLPGGPGPSAFLRGAVGFVLSLLCGWLLLRCPNGVEKLFWGRETRRNLLPLLFWCLSCCHFRSHSCSENIVADTQQDDLLAVIHRE